MKLNKIILAVFLVLVLLIPVFSFADTHNSGCDPDKDGKICNPAKYKTIQEFIKFVLEGIIKILLPLLVLAIIYSGFLFVAARGNAEKLTKAKDALLWTLVGAAVILGAFALAQLIANTVKDLG